jgi:hypothetical protein
MFAVLHEMKPCAENSSAQFKQRAVIDFLSAEDRAAVALDHRLQIVYGNDCFDLNIVCRWADRCKDGEAGKPYLCDRRSVE